MCGMASCFCFREVAELFLFIRGVACCVFARWRGTVLFMGWLGCLSETGAKLSIIDRYAGAFVAGVHVQWLPDFRGVCCRWP